MFQTNALSLTSISRGFCLNQQPENMLSLPIPSRLNKILTTSSLLAQTSCSKSFKTPILVNNRTSSVDSSIILGQNSKPISRNFRGMSSAASEALTSETTSEDAPPSPEPAQVPEKVDVVVKQVENPRLVLKFIWMEKNIGLALDQVIPGHGTVPLSPYFFWPRKDAWEELKTTLESKPWISQKKMIILLNQATDIINLWQQSGGNITA